MTFSKENQPARRRGKAKHSTLLEVMQKEVVDGMEGFLERLIKAARGDKDAKIDKQLALAILQRVDPPPKPTLPLVKFNFDVKASFAEQSQQILKAAADGKIPADIANSFISSISAALKIDEVTNIKNDVDEGMKALEGRGSEQGSRQES